ncbi:DUF1640 domain-containing protein [Lichenibacterium dinghuense]|uniref:DUF1640 domain-containing protein n=1 Tax=Lichenibacterium dinghuense TaxID=2895977 RepID=UPI001F17C177|nr:DUF1640 domain-containing protein [Lichenibacterium sp. 6Y81]
MSAVFDPLRLARNLQDKARFSPEQAEGVADAFAEAMQGDLAIKADLKSEIQSVRGELRETELRLEAKIETIEADLVKWVVGMIGFQTIVLLGAALALARAVAR